MILITLGLQPSDEYTFVVMVLPVADYYRGGLTGVPALVIEDYDRAAPRLSLSHHIINSSFDI